jgi:hypothetical protein
MARLCRQPCAVSRLQLTHRHVCEPLHGVLTAKRLAVSSAGACGKFRLIAIAHHGPRGVAVISVSSNPRICCAQRLSGRRKRFPLGSTKSVIGGNSEMSALRGSSSLTYNKRKTAEGFLLRNLLRLQFNDGVSPVPIPGSLIHAPVLFFDVGRHFDDLEHAG